MAKTQDYCLTAVVALILLLASSPAYGSQFAYSHQFVGQRARSYHLARQEVKEPITPYPSADDLKPELPFDETAAQPTPDAVYGPPDQPANTQPDQVYGPPDQAANNQPDQVYGPPDISENGLTAPEEPASEPFPPPLDEQQAKFIAVRRANLRQRRIFGQALAYRQFRSAGVASSAKLRSQPRRIA